MTNLRSPIEKNQLYYNSSYSTVFSTTSLPFLTMKISFAAITCLALSTTSAGAFAPSTNSPHRISTELKASPKWLQQKAQQTVVTAAVAASLWSAPAFLDSTGFVPSAFSTATAKEMASGSGSRVNKDAESLLRYGLPINNKEVCFVYGEQRAASIRLEFPGFFG
jgi:hypothetical protein